ncbi:hypothetical protein ILUMI_12142, partial [Ignelater luminosus]
CSRPYEELRYYTACEPTCDDPNLLKPCIAVMYYGCYCKMDYMKNFDNLCVTSRNCEIPPPSKLIPQRGQRSSFHVDFFPGVPTI